MAPNAKSLGIGARDKIVVLGAGGWFGKTFAELISPNIPVLKVASSRREDLVTWDLALIREFQPTIVVNFAFLTPERVALDGEKAFMSTNRLLLERFEATVSHKRVHSVVTVSSGAAVMFPDSPYGSMKLVEEQLARDLIGSSRNVVTARAYSVSGPFVRRPEDYVFSNFILQAREGLIRISSKEPTFRRFTDAQDFLSVCFQHALWGWSGTIESGGTLVEMDNLAREVVGVVNPRAQIVRPTMTSMRPSVYASDGTSWDEACARVSCSPKSLHEQIRHTEQRLPREPA